jgi:hypothetical protein
METKSVMSNENGNYVNKTFRLKKSVVTTLEEDAARQGISVNALIQNSINRYVEWDRYCESVQMTTFFPNMLDAVLEHIDDATIEKMAKRIVETSCFKDVNLLIFKRYDPEVFLNMILLLDKFGNSYRLQVGDTDDELWSISLYHNYGKKWSIFNGVILHNELLRLKVQHSYEVSDNTVVLRFPKSETARMGLSHRP